MLAALMVDLAANLDGRKFKGSVSLVRERTEGAYDLSRFVGAFEEALSFLEEHGIARTHSYPKVEEYISIDMSTAGHAMFHMLARTDSTNGRFSLNPAEPSYRILNSYDDVGSSWLHDYALSLKDSAPGPSSSGDVHSSSWTGRYVLSEDDKIRVIDALLEMRRRIDELPLTNSERSNALAAVAAAHNLSEAADPAWELVLRILRSPVLANVTALVALAVSIIQG